MSNNTSYTMVHKAVRDNLKELMPRLREVRRWNQEYIAKALCVGLVDVQRWEAGKTKPHKMSLNMLILWFYQAGLIKMNNESLREVGVAIGQWPVFRALYDMFGHYITEDRVCDISKSVRAGHVSAALVKKNKKTGVLTYKLTTSKPVTNWDELKHELFGVMI